MRSIVTVKYTINNNKESIVETVAFDGKGRWPSISSVDSALYTLCVSRYRGKYLPLNVVPSTVDIIDMSDVGYNIMTLSLIEPYLIDESSYNDIYVGSIEMRKLDRWAFATNVLSGAKTLSVKLQDGTSFFIHINKKSNNRWKEIKARLHRAITSIRPEWKSHSIRQNKERDVLFVSSDDPSSLDIAHHDKTTTYFVVVNILRDESDTERFFLERANIRLDNNLDPYPFARFDSAESDLFERFAPQSKKELIEAFNVVAPVLKYKIHRSLDYLSYGKIKIPMTSRIIELLARPDIYDCDVLAMYGRYISYIQGSDAQSTMSAKAYVDILRNEWDVRYEGFSGPYNNNFPTFSSLFFDVDCLFGSVGPFNYRQIIDHSEHNLTVNPPFYEAVYKLLRDSVERAFVDTTIRKEMLIFVKVPNWRQEETITWLRGAEDDGTPINNPYLVTSRVIPNGKYYFERLNGNLLTRLTGGLLFSVLSPLGNKHPNFTEKVMDDLEKRFELSNPPQVKESGNSNYIYVDRFYLPQLVEEIGEEALIKGLKDETYKTKIPMSELKETLKKIRDE